MLQFVAEAIERYDLDGIELDWMRWCHVFETSEAATNAPLLTRFTRQIRDMLDDAAARRGRDSLLLGARVASTLDECTHLGYDVNAWIHEAGIDYLCPSDFYHTDPNCPVDTFVALTEGTACAIYPSIHPAVSWGDAPGLNSLDNYRAAANNFYAQGAAGVSPYNYMYHWGSIRSPSYPGPAEMWPKSLDFLTELRRADPEHPTRSPHPPRAAVPVPVAAPTLAVLAELAATAAQPAPLAAGRHVSILFTSGSGGTPKAVVHTLGNHLASAAASAHRLPLTPRDSWLACLPLSHIGGLAILFRTLAAGARMELAAAGRFTDPGRPEVAALRSCTHASIVDTQLRRLLSLPPAALDHRPHLLVGGSAIRRHLMEAARQRGVPVYATYGCTEMCSQVATTGEDATRSYAPDRATVASEPLPGQRVRVAATGEVLLGGPTLAAGYLRAGQVRPLVDDDGWYHSGDLGRLLPDGRLVITGRRDAMFISGGENVQPERIERALLQHPAVLAACCVPRVDDEFGARPVAFLQLEGAEWASSAAPPEELLRLATSELAPHERPAAYLPMPDFGGGKPDRSALTRLAGDTGGS